MAYSFTKVITIDHTKVGTVNNTDQSNFPVLIGGSAGPYTYLKTVGNGGNIQNTVSFNGQTVPADLVFSTDSAGSSLLKWEVASYKATTGDIEVWVKIPTLSHTVDTVIYMLYGDVAVVTYQGGSVGDAWDTNYKGVYHLADGTTLGLNDSTSNARNLTNHNTSTAATGKIDGGVGLVQASTQYLSTASPASGVAMSYEAWVKASSFPGAYNTAVSSNASGHPYFDLHIKSTGKLALYAYASVNVDYDGTGSNTLSTGIWYHLAMVYDSSNGLVGYVNGTSDGTAAANGNLDTSFTQFNIGSDLPNTSGREFDGVIDEVRVSTSARSADWVVTAYNAQNSPSTFYTITTLVSTDGWLLTLIHPRGPEEETPYYVRKSAFFLTNGVPPPVPIVPFFTHRRIVDPNLWNEEERLNKHTPAWFLPQNRPTPLSPFVGNPSLVRKNLVSFLNIRSESQQIRVSQNLARVKPQTISHAMDAIQDYGDVTDSRLRDLSTGVSSVTASQAGMAKGLAGGSFGAYSAYLPNPTYPPAYVINSAISGSVDLYTVPKNRKAWLLARVSTAFFVAIDSYLQTKISGVYYRLTNTTTNAGNLGTDDTTGLLQKVLNADETVAIHSNVIGLSTWLHLVEFDATSPLRSVTLTTFSAGDNTLYTVPVGKTFEVVPSVFSSVVDQMMRSRVYYTNASGGDRILQVYAIPKGSSASVNNRIGGPPSSFVENGTIDYSSALYGSLAPGDFIDVHVDSNAAGQMAWINIIEH